MTRSLLPLTQFLSVGILCANGAHASNDAPSRDVDVAIIGGGASGTYAAVRLREDYNTSIMLIEPRARLGGSVSTYFVPETNTSLEFGVQSYLPYGPAVDFFARFGIETEAFASKRLTPLNVDAQTGAKLTEYTAPNINATNEAFQKWLEIVSKYESWMEPGYWNFPDPQDVPEDFLTRFGDFAEANQLEAAVPRILLISGVGYGGVADLLTLEVFQAFGAALTKDMIDGTLFRPVGTNSLVYERAHDLLGSDVLLSSSVQSVKQSPTSTQLTVQQGSTFHTINAKRILFAAPPSLNNLAPFSPDQKQTTVLSQLTSGAEYIGVARIPCIPENSTVTFIPSSAVPSNHLALKDYPYNLRLDSTGPNGLGLFRIVFGANYTMSTQEFKDVVTRDVQKLVDAGSVSGKCEVEFRAMSDHTRPLWKLEAEQVRGGFVQELYGLQGYRGMWWTGYAWAAPYSSTIWAFTDTVLPKLVEDLKAGGGE